MPPDDLRRLSVELFGLGVQLRVEGDRVRWKAPQGRMTIDLVRRIKAHEAGLIETLGRIGEPTTAHEKGT